MGFGDDKRLDVLQNIEFGLKNEYEKNGQLTDSKTIVALDYAKIAVKQEFGFAKNEKLIVEDITKGIIDWCVTIGKERIDTVNNLALKEYVSCIDKIKRSVDRHSRFGKRAYYEFIKEYVQ